jgi:hypothetical protein
MKKVIELNKPQIVELQNLLDRSDLSMYSLPLRQQIWYAQQNMITDGRVYVDQWPNFQHICSLHTSKQFISEAKFDFDVATFYSMNENADEIGQDLESFLNSLVIERQWSKRSMYANYVQVNLVDSFKNILDKYGKIDQYGAYLPYTGLEKTNVEKYRNRLNELSAQLPQELMPDILRPMDIQKVIENWPYGPPDVVPSFYQWLLQTFPSTCLRNRKKNNKLVAWACSYSCGAMANLFIDEEYRGRGLSEYLWLSIGLKLTDFCRLQPYFDITPGNTPSIKSSEKAFKFDRKEGDKLTTWFFFYNREQFPE